MFSHMMVGSNDLDASRKFYDALFEKKGRTDDKGGTTWGRKGALFMLAKPLNGQPATHANGGTIGFSFDSAEEVAAWHARGVAAGGTTCENPPGYRENPFGKVYLAYLRDPAGNKLCGVYRPPQ